MGYWPQYIAGLTLPEIAAEFALGKNVVIFVESDWFDWGLYTHFIYFTSEVAAKVTELLGEGDAVGDETVRKFGLPQGTRVVRTQGLYLEPELSRQLMALNN